MSVEIDCYNLKKSGDGDLVEKLVVRSASWEEITFLGKKIAIMVICNVDNTEGTVWIFGKNLNKIFYLDRYIDSEDFDGTRVKKGLFRSGSRFKITNSQAFSITTKRKPYKQVLLFLNKEDRGGGDRDPTDLPLDGRPLAKV